MKKLLLTLLISLNLAMPAHAGVGVSITSIGGVAGVAVGGIIMVLGITLEGMSIYHELTGPLEREGSTIFTQITALILFDGEKNSENNLVSVNVLNDIEALIDAKIYTETEGNDLKSEWRDLEYDLSRPDSLHQSRPNLSESGNLINPKQSQDMSPEEVVATIQFKASVSKLFAEYLASKMSVQVQ